MRIEDSGVIFRNPLPGHRALNAIYPFVLPLPDGDWVCALRTGSALYSPDGVIEMFRSSDAGHSWGEKVAVAVGTDHGRSYSHGQPCRLADERVYVSLWTADPDLQAFHDLHTFVSTDASAREWETPRATGIPGQTGGAVELSPGRMLIIYSHREGTDQPGIKIVSSHDGGRTWNVDQPLTVWDAYGKEARGSPESLSSAPARGDARPPQFVSVRNWRKVLIHDGIREFDRLAKHSRWGIRVGRIIWTPTASLTISARKIWTSSIASWRILFRIASLTATPISGT